MIYNSKIRTTLFLNSGTKRALEDKARAKGFTRRKGFLSDYFDYIAQTDLIYLDDNSKKLIAILKPLVAQA